MYVDVPCQVLYSINSNLKSLLTRVRILVVVPANWWMCGAGFYMTLPRGAVQRGGDRAWLISPTMNGSPDPMCIAFWLVLVAVQEYF